MNASIPLEEVLPFSPRSPRKVLVCDSVETDGRFLCYTHAKQALNAKSHVLWLLGTPVTEAQVATGLKKMGCDAGASYLRSGPSAATSVGGDKSLTIRSLSSELATAALEPTEEGDEWHEEAFLKKIYKETKNWLLERLELTSTTKNACWIILDDMSTLSTMLSADSLVYQFVDTLCALVSRTGKADHIGLLVRASHQLDQKLLNRSDEDFAKDQSGWVGAGGLAHRLLARQNQLDWIPWERTLMESMDGLVDVLPLTSGYSREAHGRLIFSEVPGGRGWSESKQHNASSSSSSSSNNKHRTSPGAWNQLLFNYCINDNGVKAIRLRAQ